MKLLGALQRYGDKGADARRLAATSLAPHLGVKFSVSEISNRVLEHIEKWPPDLRNGEVNFDWREIKRAHREPNRLEIAIWCGERLCGVALCLLKSNYVEVRFVEGDPNKDCPLRGYRVLIVLECAANYAQGLGRREIRIQPINDTLAELYIGVYGFVEERPKNRSAYFRKEV
ncbi:hypothetical protein [Aureimonas sp. D3]|uniref:hypothetical protein n=1 Tax=Aureimonas sp. D3 TaxID=1638164 RepID=UPI0012E3DC92|nr:hypothetical protein [Aureimonas sp. D3]